MQIITFSLIAYIFVCMVLKHLILHRAQFYMAFGGVLLIMLLTSLAAIIHDGAFHNVLIVMCMLLQLATFFLLVLATGGLSLRELTGEFTHAIEVVRRGEEEKETIIPPVKRPMAGAASSRAKPADDEDRVVFRIDDPPGKPANGGTGGSLPLE